MSSNFNNMFEHLFDTPFQNGINKTATQVSETNSEQLISYIKRIKELEAQVILLANNLATMSSKPHEQNTDHWIELTIMQVRKR